MGRNAAGFGLVEVMVALVVGGVIMTGFMSINKQMSDGYHLARHKSASMEYQKDVQEALKSSLACTETFKATTFTVPADIGAGKKSVAISKIMKEGPSGLAAMADLTGGPAPIAGLSGSKLEKMAMADFEIVSGADKRFRARLRMSFEDNAKSPMAPLEIPIFIKGKATGSVVSVESCSSSSIDWLSEEDRLALTQEICTRSGGTYNSTTKICVMPQVTALESKVTTLESQIASMQTQIRNLASTTSTTTTVVTNNTSTPVATPTPSGTVTGGGTCTPPTSGTCAGNCGGGTSSCPNLWRFTGSGRSGGCSGNNRMQNTSVSTGGTVGFICVAN